MKKSKAFNFILSIFIILGTLSPGFAGAAPFEEIGQRAISPVEEVEFNGEPFVAKPLVILMDFKDYTHEQLTEKEDWTINGFEGEHFTPEFFEEMFFGEETYTGSDGREFVTINKFYKESSGGSFALNGGVAGWYMSEHDAAYYGGSQADATYLVMEAIEQAAADTGIDLSDYDVEDKWDYDNDGNYYEPDGIIDTLIIIHAGKGEEWENSLGEDAIWPFRAGLSWYSTTDYEKYELTDHQDKTWEVDDFVVMEQDLPLDLMAHEYGHVLGLPDLYSTGGSYPPVENWSLMGGSYTGVIPGTFPNDYGAWCKEFLQNKFSEMFENDEENSFTANWQSKVTYDIDEIGSEGIDVILDQTSINGKNKDAVRIDLPQKETIIATPPSGSYAYFSGKGDNLLNYMTTVVDLVYAADTTVVDYVYATDINLSFKTWYDIDPGFDFCSVQVRESGSEEWTAIEGNITTTDVDDWIKENETEEDIKERNPGHGITNDSGGEWVDAEFDLSQYAGKKIELRFRWRTDSNTPEQGIYIDDIKITGDGEEILFDDADGEGRFELDGFERNSGRLISDHYYLLEWRNNTGDIDKLYTSWSETLVYDPGLIIWYIDEMWGGEGRPDQNTWEHPGQCFAGVVDAGQEPVLYEYNDGRGGPDRVGYQMYDAAFSLRENSGYYISADTYEVFDSNIAPKPIFDDSRDYRSIDAHTEAGLILPDHDLRILVVEESNDRSTAKIHIMRSDEESTYSNDEETMKIDSISIAGEDVVVEASGVEVELSEKAYIGYTHQGTGITKEMPLTLKDGKYKASLFSLNAEEDGLWQASFIILEDTEGNAKAFYNSNLYSGYGIDLSSGDFDKSQGQYTVNITNIRLLDRFGNEKNEFNIENAVNVEASISVNEEELEGVVVIEIKDQRDTPYAMRYVPIVKDLNVYSQGFTLYNVEKGEHTVNVYVWDSLNDRNALCQPKTFTFTVK